MYSFLASLSLIFILVLYLAGGQELQTYIVHVKEPQGTVMAPSENIETWYHSFFTADAQPRMLYSYRHVFTGFAARLTENEVSSLEKKDYFLFARLERMLSIQTTHSPTFLGLHQGLGLWHDSEYGKSVIIGVLDTGIHPYHPSFNDEGMPNPPAKWKGKCDFNGTACNNKIIGARTFHSTGRNISGDADRPPLDDHGHGTHTASIAAGAFVKDANVLGNAYGTAVGMAPYAHLAIYKVCVQTKCPESDILAAMDAAVGDGVDVLSLSFSTDSLPFFADPIAIGTFSAMQKGVLVSCAAGNSGPYHFSVANEAPWILTVGASTIDRSMRAIVVLGNGKEFDGESIFQPRYFHSRLLPLVYPGMNGDPSAALCAPGSLNNTNVKGKIVLCEVGGGIKRKAKGQTVNNAGGAAMILMNDKFSGFGTSAMAHVLPAIHVSYAAGLKVKAYINSTPTPSSTIIFRGTIIGLPMTPSIAAFSSRGPSLASPGILKPDIVGPGVNILAAWPYPLYGQADTKLTFNMISGTSMSTPHLSGIMALLKSGHPDWSPAAIKSAIMTTADVLNRGNKFIFDQTHLPADIFAIGAGHVNPQKAYDPGLVYDILPNDYIPYLCGLGYTDDEVTIIVSRMVKCTDESSIPEAELNYPSFAITLPDHHARTYTRTVTNVGVANLSYTLKIVPPQGVHVEVKPDRLQFAKVNEKKSYQVTFHRLGGTTIRNQFAQGYLIWFSEKHFVRSPIAVMFKL